MNATIAAIIGASVGSGITGAFALIAIWLQRRSEERRQIRELAVQVALENWKIYKENSERNKIGMQPLDVYLIHAMTLVSCLDGRLKTPEDIREHLRSGFEAFRAAAESIQEESKKNAARK